MAVNFVNISREKFLEENKHIYRFTNLERIIETLNTEEFTFINPLKWTDPFEKFFLAREYLIDGNKVYLPAKDRIFAVCTSGTLNSEAYWKVYAPKEDGVRLTFNTKEFLSKFLDKINDADIFIGKVVYQLTKDFSKISFDSNKLIEEIENNKIGVEQIRLLLKKRKSFLYEDETRIIIVPKHTHDNKTTFKTTVDIREFTESYTFDPRIGINQYKLLRDYFDQKYEISTFRSSLYTELKRKPIELVKRKKVLRKRTK